MIAAVYSAGARGGSRRSRRVRRSRRKLALGFYCVLAVALFFVVNWIYQAMRKPVELLAPISDSFAKSPEATWQSYGPLFERYSTSILAPEFLAALAQIEGSGNPIVRTYWRWQWSWNPFEIYRPASSAVGMFQITDGTFIQARKLCIRDHRVLTDGQWHDPHSCWFNSLYSRAIPSHSTQMTAAYLHQSVLNALGERKAGAMQKERLAAVIHLCGFKRGESFARRGFRAAHGERCGAHDMGRYLDRVDRMKKRFARLRSGGSN